MFGLCVVLDDYGKPRVRHTFYRPTDDGREVALWQDRATLPGKYRWLTPRDATLTLYNLPALRCDDITGAVICEGPADTISATVALKQSAHMRIVAVGVPGAGNWQKQWAHLFDGLGVLIITDNDDAGLKLRADIERDLSRVHCTARHLTLPADVNDLNDWCLKHGHSAVGDVLGAATPHRPETDTHDPHARCIDLLNDAGITHEEL
jgi:5S rRNA maturation endonuclease (ribonuclease M5)